MTKYKTKKIMSHITPETHLREFSVDGVNIGRYDIKTSSPDDLPIDKVGAEKNYFAFKDNTGDLKSIEKLLSDIAEAPYREIIRKMRDNEDPTEQDMDYLASFLTVQFLRPKKLRQAWEKFNIMATIRTAQEDIKSNPKVLSDFYHSMTQDKSFTGSKEELKKQILLLNGDEAKWAKNYASYSGSLILLELFKDTYKNLRSLHPRFLFNPACGVITSDHPYFIWQPDQQQRKNTNLSLGFNAEQIYFPLAKDIVIVLSKEFPKNVLSLQEVNQHLVNAAERFIYFPSQTNIENLLKQRVPEMQYIVVNEDEGIRFSRI